MIVETVLAGWRQPCLHMGKGPQYGLHHLYTIIVDVLFVQFAVDCFAQIGTSFQAHQRASKCQKYKIDCKISFFHFSTNMLLKFNILTDREGPGPWIVCARVDACGQSVI